MLRNFITDLISTIPQNLFVSETIDVVLLTTSGKFWTCHNIIINGKRCLQPWVLVRLRPIVKIWILEC